MIKQTVSLLKQFRRAEKGSVAIVFTVALSGMLIAAGTAIDYIRASNAQADLQNALDASALAAATSRDLSDDSRIDLANSVFSQNWQGTDVYGYEVKPQFAIEDRKISGTAKIKMPTTFMRIAGIETMDVGSRAAVQIPEANKAEIAMVLDYSSSMYETPGGGEMKYVAMRRAAINLVEDLGEIGKDRVKVGLVPFSDSVYVTLPGTAVAGFTGSGSWTGCIQDRLHGYNLSDSSPNPKDDTTKWDPSKTSTNCATYKKNGLKIRPLSDDLAGVTAQLKSMTPYDYTHIALGAEFGWHLLSSNTPFTEGVAYGDKETKKYMVILTDGRQTTQAWAANGSRTVTNGERNLEKICTAAKKNITIITIAFDLQDAATRNRLRNCATDPDKHFFVAEDNEALASAFQEIKAVITEQAFLSE
ncbi:MAG: VWA domain-containing protein [Parvibaculaceae bacterium]|jgi:Flp pilus assembly protein TadG